MRLIQDRNLPSFDIPDAKGRSSFSEILRGLRVGTQTTKLNAILIVSDNDNDPVRSFGEVQDQIRIATGYPVPEKPMEAARAVGQPIVLIMMLPWIDTPGSLETLLRMVLQREQEAMMVCVDEFLKCTKVTEWEIQKRDKAAIQCFIAGSNHEDPNKTLRYLLESKNNPLPMNALELDNIANTLKNFETVVADRNQKT
jgi:hypothetical protein